MFLFNDQAHTATTCPNAGNCCRFTLGRGVLAAAILAAAAALLQGLSSTASATDSGRPQQLLTPIAGALTTNVDAIDQSSQTRLRQLFDYHRIVSGKTQLSQEVDIKSLSVEELKRYTSSDGAAEALPTL